MKRIIIILAMFLGFTCQNKKIQKQIVEMSCGQCQFGLTSKKGCNLAVRINGDSYFVDGPDIDDFGDAHDEKTGFCEVIRKAEVNGNLQGGRFKVSSVELLD
ncbi:DUF6370 family protein [Hyunsoonleella aestuarii]|nr:DUF6370 family protein [Hyunsoonleella aestuarii]